VSGDPYQPLASKTEDGSDSELELCARLLRALSHRIRGDLSVVTNDLVYLSSLVDPAELERPRARCTSIASVLSPLGILAATNHREHSTLLSLSGILGLSLDRSTNPSTMVTIDATLVRQAVQLLRQLLGPWTGSVITTDESPGVVTCIVQFEQPRALQRSYSSVGRMAVAELGERFVVEACLVDLILRNHNWPVELTYDGKRFVCALQVASYSD